jgi:hypothetical protein
MSVLIILWRNDQKIIITFSGTPIGATGEFPGQVISIILRIVVLRIVLTILQLFNPPCLSSFKILMNLEFIIKFIGRNLYFFVCNIHKI